MGKKDIDFPTDDSSSVSPFTNFGNRVPRYELSTSVILEQMKSKGMYLSTQNNQAAKKGVVFNSQGEKVVVVTKIS